MPCYIGDCEKKYYENQEALQILESINIALPEGVMPNEKLCNLCSKMDIHELTDRNLLKWYLNHLYKDGENDAQKVVQEILRLYSISPQNNQPKYKVGQEVWLLNDDNMPYSTVVKEVSEECSQPSYLCDLQFELEEYLYPSKEELILSKIKHWSDMLEPKEEYCDVSGVKLGASRGEL